jgi:hypothetical protein
MVCCMVQRRQGMGSLVSTRRATVTSNDMKDTDSSHIDRLTEAQLEEFKEAFNTFDKDRSGQLDADELHAVCEWMGQDSSDAEINDMMALGAQLAPAAPHMPCSEPLLTP